MSSNQLNKLSRHLFRQALEALPGPVLIIDAQSRDRVVLFANGPGAALWGKLPAELLGQAIGSQLVEDPAPGSAAPWRLQTPAGTVVLAPVPLYADPGAPACWLLTPVGSGESPAIRPAASGAPGPTPARSVDPGATGTFATGSFSVTETWIRMRDDRNDPATGVLSREAFLEVLERDLSAERPADRNVNVMLFRVEGVESYQALFGRHATDACLRKVAHSISTNLRRGSDACGRTGASEFTVVSQGGDPGTTAEFAARIAQRVRDLAIHHPRAGNGRFVTVSWGLMVAGGGSGARGTEALRAAAADLERRLALLPPSAASAG